MTSDDTYWSAVRAAQRAYWRAVRANREGRSSAESVDRALRILAAAEHAWYEAEGIEAPDFALPRAQR